MFETNKQDKDKEVQELGKWGSEAGYKLGFLAGSTTFGLMFGVILGAFSILNHSKNEGLKISTRAVSKRAQHDRVSLKDLEQLSAGKPISNQKCIRAAIFIDGLENKLGSLRDGKKVGNNYTFTKIIEPNGLINYTVEDSKTNQIALSFDLDRDGKIAVQSRTETEITSKLDEFIMLNASKASVNVDEGMSLYSDEIAQTEVLEQEIDLLKTSIESVKRFNLNRLAIGSNSAQPEYVQSLFDLNNRLLELKMQAKTIQNQIHTAEVANDKEGQRHPENTLLGIKVSCLVDKLVGLNKQIDGLQADVQGKPQTVEEVKAYRQEERVESTAPPNEIDALKQEIRELQERVKVLTPDRSTSNQQQSRFALPPLPSELNQVKEAPVQHRSFSEESEYPDLPADLNELQVSQFPELDELLQVSESPANGQPIIIVESEAPDYAQSQGMEQ